MYSSRGNSAYGQQQSSAAKQTYGQSSGADGRQSSIQGSAAQDADIAGYRGHPSASTHCGGPYGAVYGSSAVSSAQQVGAMSDKGAASSALQGRTGYSSGITGFPMFASADYVSSSSHGYGPKSDQLSSGKLSEYSSIDRQHYDLQSEVTRRYTDSASLGHQLQQPEIYDRIDQASLLRQQQLLKSQPLQSASPLDGGARPADYLIARGAPIRHSAHDLSVYGGRLDADPRSLSMLSGLPYDGQHQASSILGAAPRRNADDLLYAAQGSATSGYGVSLPPGRDYGNAKGLHVTSHESDYPNSLLSLGGGLGGSRMDERKADRGTFRRELEIREEERRRDHLRERAEREQDRDRERERERERERRDKDRERERKRVPVIRRERTPPRITRERHGSSLGKEEKSLGRDSQCHNSQHRHHSPVKEIRREYVCKVHPSCLVDVERDYLSVSKRYPRLFVSPDFTKAVVNWPKENLNISFSTPVSFEHDLVEVESFSVKKEASFQPVAESGEPTGGAIIWNAKVILMSGISKDALEELSSNKNYDDRIPHINNTLRFSFLRKDRAFMAIGGPLGVVDGGDPSDDDSSLIKTAISYTKDITQLDLQKCQQWNRFLEIHYDRLGKDGLFSHKEITVLYIPDLSECLPSLDAWRDQLLAHKKVIDEREQRLAAHENKKSVEENSVKGGQSSKKSDKDADSSKTVKVEGKLIKPVKEEKKESDGTPSKKPIDGKKMEKSGSKMLQENVTEKEKGVADGKYPDSKDKGEGGDDVEALGKKGTKGTPIKSGKKKIIKKVVKQKKTDKKAGEEIAISTDSRKGDVDKQGASNTTVNPDGTTVDPSNVKTLMMKKFVKKVPAGKTPGKEDKGLTSNDTQGVLKLEKPVDGQEDGKDNASVQQVAVKTSGKKIIKRVPKRKASQVGSSSVGADGEKDGDNDEKKVVLKGSDDENMKEQAASAEKVMIEEKKMVKKTNTKPKLIKTSVSKKAAAHNANEKDEDREKKGLDDKKDCSAKKESDTSKEKSYGKDSLHLNKEKVKDANEKKGKDEKDDLRPKLSKDVKEKGNAEEPPKHPGLVLQTISSKDSKIRSMSLSLDSLLDYNDKDIDESTFELSLFAEALYEMLQYQMGCRLLTFLQKLRFNFVKKRNQKKRERDENPVKDKVKPSKKKLKTTEATPMDKETTKDANSNHKEDLTKGDPSIDGHGDSKVDDEADDYDPEEDIDDDQEIEAEFLEHDEPKEAGNNDEPDAAEVKVEKGISKTHIKTEVYALGDKADEKGDKTNSSAKEAEVEAEANKKPAKEEGIVDKELLQAFRFFDRNRTGYIKVEDLRSIIHNLGKFLSHRDVKELVQCGLIESNTARDNRILYNNLVKLSKYLH